MKNTIRLVALTLLLAASADANAGLIDWLQSKLSPSKPVQAPVQVADKVHGPVMLDPGEAVHVRIDAATPTAKLPGGISHYRRFNLPKSVAHAMVRVRVLTEHHDHEPRFTVFAPQLYVLDDAGEIRAAEPVQPLRLSIRPFRRAELHGCLRVDNLRSFLLADDPAHLGKVYEFNARPAGASRSRDGFYRGTSTMDVYLPFANTGELVLRVLQVEANDQC